MRERLCSAPVKIVRRGGTCKAKMANLQAAETFMRQLQKRLDAACELHAERLAAEEKALQDATALRDCLTETSWAFDADDLKAVANCIARLQAKCQLHRDALLEQKHRHDEQRALAQQLLQVLLRRQEVLQDAQANSILQQDEELCRYFAKTQLKFVELLDKQLRDLVEDANDETTTPSRMPSVL